MNQEDRVVPEMRERLSTNRYGKLTANQWMDMVLQPLMSILVLSIPMMIFLPRLLFSMGLMLITAGFLVILGMLVMRAYRYARAPVHFAYLRATSSTHLWLPWQNLRMVDKDQHVLQFKKRLAPAPRVQKDRTYIVYYLRDHESHILLSLAPVNHPNLDNWLPTKVFERRFRERGGGEFRKENLP